MLREYDVVRLREARQEAGLSAGAVGTIVSVCGEPPTYEVEFCDDHGATTASLPLSEADLVLAADLMPRSARQPASVRTFDFAVPEILLQIAIGLFNTVCGSLVGWWLGPQLFRRRTFRGDHLVLGLNRSQAITIVVVACALIGLIWGKRIWKSLDRRIDRGWPE